MAIKLSYDGFRSEKAAKVAGEKALRQLLEGIAKETAKESET
jgi:hypothetical protein